MASSQVVKSGTPPRSPKPVEETAPQPILAATSDTPARSSSALPGSVNASQDNPGQALDSGQRMSSPSPSNRSPAELVSTYVRRYSTNVGSKRLDAAISTSGTRRRPSAFPRRGNDKGGAGGKHPERRRTDSSRRPGIAELASEVEMQRPHQPAVQLLQGGADSADSGRSWPPQLRPGHNNAGIVVSATPLDTAPGPLTATTRVAAAADQKSTNVKDSPDKTMNESKQRRLRSSSQWVSVRKSGGGLQLVGDYAYTEMVVGFNTTVNNLKHTVNAMAVSALVGIVLELVQREYAHLCGGGTQCDLVVNSLRGVLSLSTLFLLYYVYMYHTWAWKFSQLDRAYLSHSALWTSSRIITVCVEMLVCSLHSFPFVDVDVDISTPNGPSAKLQNPWGLVVLLRFYVIQRLVAQHYYTGGTKILGIWYNFSFSTSFVMRNVLYSFPFRVMVPIIVVTSLIAAYVMMVCERQVPGSELLNSQDFLTYLWVTYITMTGVGYGDIVPVTSCGRFVAVASAIVAIVVTAILVATIYAALTLLPYESRMVEFLERVNGARVLKAHAAKVIQAAYRFHKAKRTRVPGVVLTVHRRRLVDALFAFQAYRKSNQSSTVNLQHHQLFRTMLEDIDDKLTTLFLKYFRLESLEDPNSKPIDVEILEAMNEELLHIKGALNVQGGPGSIPGVGVKSRRPSSTVAGGGPTSQPAAQTRVVGGGGRSVTSDSGSAATVEAVEAQGSSTRRSTATSATTLLGSVPQVTARDRTAVQEALARDCTRRKSVVLPTRRYSRARRTSLAMVHQSTNYKARVEHLEAELKREVGDVTSRMNKLERDLTLLVNELRVRRHVAPRSRAAQPAQAESESKEQ